MLRFSIIIPVYNRPDELKELLESLLEQTDHHFEVIIVEDGSTLTSKDIVGSFCAPFPITYLTQSNTGPSQARNHGIRSAKGNYFILFDSDCLIPPDYIARVRNYLSLHYSDAYGGPDAAHDSFSLLQKAINYAMTAIFTTGGIRGKKRAMGRFQARSFNMGFSQEVFDATQGFSDIFPGEDPDLSLRIWEAGYNTQLLPHAFVYHKRRTSMLQFIRQVHNFGRVRPILNFLHPTYRSFLFFFPSVLLLSFLFSLGLFFIGWATLPLYAYALYALLVFIHASYLNKDIFIGLLAVITSFTQLGSYGLGFLETWIPLQFSKKHPRELFPNHFKTKGK